MTQILTATNATNATGGSDALTLRDKRDDQISEYILDAAFKIHRHFGPGLLENVYEACLRKALLKAGLKVETQVPVRVEYDGDIIDVAFRLDMIVEDSVIVEIKAVEQFLPLHEAQIISYMKLKQARLGMLINFNTILLKNGIKRLVLREKTLRS
jgi:GxxExxY protein